MNASSNLDNFCDSKRPAWTARGWLDKTTIGTSSWCSTSAKLSGASCNSVVAKAWIGQAKMLPDHVIFFLAGFRLFLKTAGLPRQSSWTLQRRRWPDLKQILQRRFLGQLRGGWTSGLVPLLGQLVGWLDKTTCVPPSWTAQAAGKVILGGSGSGLSGAED